MRETTDMKNRVAYPAPLSLPPASSEVRSPETRADSARVESDGYESLNAEQTKQAFTELDSVLNGLADTVVHTLNQTIPYLAKMQSLLSQRGSARKMVLKAAGLPLWTEWAESFADKFDCSLRTIQEHIQIFRRGKSNSDSTGTSARKRGKSLKLDSRQQSALVKAQLAANDLVFALKNDGDWQGALVEYDKVAVTPAKLDSFVNALNPEPDWKSVLSRFVATLELHHGNLPVPVMAEMRSVQELLGGTPNVTQADEPASLGDGPQPTLADASQSDRLEQSDDAGEEQTNSFGVYHQTPVECTNDRQPQNREPAASVKVTKCPPAYESESEGSCERILTDARSYHPGSITKQGYVPNEDGKWEYVGKPDAVA